MRRHWTNEEIQNEIMDIVSFLDIDRMPTLQEMDTYYGNSGLSNKVCKTGGVSTWAKILGLEIKPSDTQIGLETEISIMNILEDFGFKCEMTPTRHPYDLLVDDCVKVDVKSARKSKVHGSDVYSFRLAKPQQTCDVYVAVCLNDDKTPKKTYVIPAHVLTGKTQLAVGVNDSKYDIYLDRWELIEYLSQSFSVIM